MRHGRRGVRRGLRYIVAMCVLVGACAGHAHAVTYGQYYDYVYKIQIKNDNYFWINVVGSAGVNFSAAHGCAQPFFARSAYDLSDTRTKAMLELAKASLAANTNSLNQPLQVYVRTDGCTTAGYPIMIDLQLENPRP